MADAPVSPGLDHAQLLEIAAKHRVDASLLMKLIEIERKKVHLERRRGVKDELRRTIEQHLEESEP